MTKPPINQGSLFVPADGARCEKCGLPLGFKQLASGKWCPTNPDGSDHWDLCRLTWLANMTPGQRARIAEKDRLEGLGKRQKGLSTLGYFYCGDVPPWDESLAPFRKFTAEEKAARVICELVTP